MEAHEYAKVFPMATEQEIADMAADIKKRGLLVPIVILEGKILDGRNRAAACKLAGVALRTSTYAGTDPLADVVSWNLHRRQLSASQRAVVAMELLPMFKERAKDRQREHGNTAPGKTLSPNSGEVISKSKATEEAAKAANVGHSILEAAQFVEKHEPELIEKIKAGEMTVNKAQEEVKKKIESRAPQKTREVTEAMQFARMAISQLERIRTNDPKREAAFQQVEQWIKGHRQ